jgi:hypothetical protein
MRGGILSTSTLDREAGLTYVRGEISNYILLFQLLIGNGKRRKTMITGIHECPKSEEKDWIVREHEGIFTLPSRIIIKY